MAGKFLRREAIVDTVKSEHRTNSIRRRGGLERHPIRTIKCGCSDAICGAYHVIETERAIPTAAEADARLAEDAKARKIRTPRGRPGPA